MEYSRHWRSYLVRGPSGEVKVDCDQNGIVRQAAFKLPESAGVEWEAFLAGLYAQYGATATVEDL